MIGGAPLQTQPKLHVEQLEARTMLSHTLVVGHRGNSMFAPENTLSSMDQAFRRGADVVEVDIQFAANGEIVAMHDLGVERTTDGTGDAASMTVAQLKTLDAGSWFSDEYIGERVPTLKEFFEVAAQRGIIYLDLKTYPMGSAIAQLLDELELPDESIWTSANTEALARDAHEHLPGASVLWWGDVPNRPKADYFQHMRSIGVAGFDLRWGDFSHRFARDAQSNGMFFSTWTIDARDQWQAALNLNVDAIETNDPGGLAKLIAERSGQVTAQLNAGRLLVQGDALDNSVRVEPGSLPGSVRVSGLNGTAVNGAGSIEFAGVRDVSVVLTNGNDHLEIVDLLLDGDLTVDGGRGNDHVSIHDSTIGGTVAFLGGAGSDWFGAEGSAFQQVRFIAASGFDTLDIGLESVVNARDNDIVVPPIYSKVERLAS
jgi:glycerophosphoryl diester phosphodiesterase